MEPRRVILLVNRNQRNLRLLVRLIEHAGYPTLSAVNLEAFDQALTNPASVALALIDVTGFNEAIWQRCDQLFQETIPFLVIAPRDLPALHQACLAHGARQTLIKPLAPQELMGAVHRLMEAGL